MIAATVAGYLIYERVQEFGSTITIRFSDASGVRPGQTEIKYRGVSIGQVSKLELSQDLQHVLVVARLHHSATPVARTGSMFWIVRPEVGLGNITGLGTVLSGPEIQVLPGTGEPKAEFIGLDKAPVALERKGLNIIVRAAHADSLKHNTPVYYRGVEVGAVQDVGLNSDATAADIQVFIKHRYANLVRSGSRFWNVSGVEMSAGLFRGLHVKVESLSSVVGGGIAFATPSDPGAKPVRAGTVFPLYDAPQPEWLKWQPQIPIAAEK